MELRVLSIEYHVWSLQHQTWGIFMSLGDSLPAGMENLPSHLKP